MMKKLFGGKKEEPKKEVDKDEEQRIKEKKLKLEMEKEIHRLNKTINDLDNNIERNMARQAKLEQETKELMTKGMKVRAKSKLQEMVALKKQTEQIDNRKNVMIDAKTRLDMEIINIDSGKAIQSFNNIIAQIQDQNEALDEQIQQYQENIQLQQETENMFQQLAANNENANEVDDMLAQYEQEMNQEQSNKVMTQMLNIPDANTNTNFNQNHQQTHVINVQSQNQNQRVIDDFN